jgi:hypothetical protein
MCGACLQEHFVQLAHRDTPPGVEQHAQPDAHVRQHQTLQCCDVPAMAAVSKALCEDTLRGS